MGKVAPSEARIASAMGQGSLVKCVTYLFPEVPEAETGTWVTTYREFYRDEGAAMVTAYPGVPETLEALRASGKRLAVTSNKGEVLLRSGLQDLGLLDFFELVIGELPGQPKKPHPETWHHRVAPYFQDLAPSDVLVVGDGEPDMGWAKAIGATACLAMYGYGAMDELVAYEPQFRIDSFVELLQHL